MNNKFNFAALHKALEKIDNSKYGKYGACGNWSMALGGYDTGYEIYYKKHLVVGRVNYEEREYEVYDTDFITKDMLPAFLAAIDARGFENVGSGWDDDEDTVNESLDTYKCHKCRTPTREDHFRLPALLNSWFVKSSEKPLWKKFLNDNKDAIYDLGVESGWYSDFEPLCERCCDEIEKSPKYKELVAKWNEISKSVENSNSVTENENMKSKKVVNETKLPVMWAIDYRDMHSAIHGLYYSKDRKVVEEFYEGLKEILDNNDPDYVEYQKESDYQMLWDEFYSRGIREIDEINFRDIGKLPSGKYGIIIDDVEYRLVNPMNHIDIYEESKDRKMGLKFKKMVKEGKYPFYWIRFCDARNKLGQACEDMQQAYYESNDSKYQDYYNRMSAIWQELSSQKFNESRKVVKESDNETKYSLDINGKEELDELYSLVAAGLNSKVSDAKFFVAKKWRDRLGKFYGDILATKDLSQYDEANGDEDSGTPRIYVGTYAKYNDGSLDGKWIDLTAFDTYEEFVDYCRALHKDEKDPEFMVQDFENYPKKWYHEGGLPTEEEFEKINEFYLMDDSKKDAYEAFVNYTGDDDIQKFEESYECEYTSDQDFGYYLVDNFGWDGVGENNLEMYFDYDAFGRDIMMDFSRGEEGETDAEGNPQDPDHYYDQDGYDMGEYESDEQVARDWVDNVGWEGVGKETAQNYFDYEGFGRDCLINDYFVSDGYVFRNY